MNNATLTADAAETKTTDSQLARPVIVLDHIHKIYRMGDVEVHALRGISLTIREGELKEGEMVITAQNSANASRTQSGTGQRAPGFGGAPGGGPGGGGRMR